MHNIRFVTRPGFLLVLFTLAASCSAVAQLREKYHGFNEDNAINGMSFFTPSNGFVAFENFIGFTVDSGQTYTPKYVTYNNTNYNGVNVNLTFGFYPSGVKAFSNDSLFIYGDYGAEPSILFSPNGGNSWRLVYHRNYNPNSPHMNLGITDLKFPGNGNVGFAVHHEGVLRTTNRGQSWSTCLIATNLELRKLSFPSVNTGYAIGHTRLFKTINSGNSWTELNLPQNNGNPANFNNVDFLNDNVGYISDFNNKWVYKTINGGITWTLMNPSEFWLAGGYDMHFINETTGYFTAGNFGMVRTNDEGRTWELCKKNSDYQYLGYGSNALFFFNDQIAWSGGDNEFLLITTNGAVQTLPKAAGSIDTAGVYSTNIVHLNNLSRTVYQYQWLVNSILTSTSYNASYSHDPARNIDTIQLIVSNGIDADTLERLQYFIVPPPPPIPEITSFTPTTASSGTIVTIHGIHFTGTTSVNFGNIPASSFSVANDNTIYATVSSGATGNISLTTPYGTASLAGFIYTTQLKINSFSPASGPVGTIVNIYGSNFSPVISNNIVYFGTIRANVLSSTATQITVMVPPGSIYKPISVTVNNLTAYSSLPFLVTFPYGETITAASFPNKVDSSVNVNYSLQPADLDNDGKPDLVMDLYSALNSITVLRNTSINGAVSFEPKKTFELSPGSNSGYGRCAITDMNGDGKLDLIASNSNSLCYLANISSPGNINFSPRVSLPNTAYFEPEYISSADFDLDGRPDIFGLQSGILTVFQNTTSNGTVSVSPVFSNNVFASITGNCVAGDLNGDGKPEMIFSALYNGVWSIYVYRNTSNAGIISFQQTILPIVNPFGKIALADMNGDGKLEIAISNNNQGVCVLRNTSTGGNISFGPRVDLPVPLAIRSIAANDLNGDGRPDLVLSSIFPRKLMAIENTGSSGSISFAPAVEFPLLENIGELDVTLADFDLDGKCDIGSIAQKVSILLSQVGVSTVQICEGGPVVFDAGITGTSYQWQQNAGSGFVNINDNSNFSGTNTDSLHINNSPTSWNEAQYRCLVNNNYSKTFKTVIHPIVTPDVSISAASTSICPGTTATFTATATNAGTTPLYQWMINGINTGTNNNVFSSSSLNNNDQVSVILTSNASCISSTTDTSNILTVTVNPIVTPSVSITASGNNICQGTPMTFTAVPVNGGASPNYQWQVNGVNTGIDTNALTISTLNNNDQVHVIMTSSACAAPPVATSNSIIASIDPALQANAGNDHSICQGNSTTIGSAASGQTYSWTSYPAGFTSNQSNNTVNPNVTTTYYLTVSNGASCPGHDTVIVTVNSLPPVNAGPDKTNCIGATFGAHIGSLGIPGIIYSWSPTTGLSASNTSETLALPNATTSYILTATNSFGCVKKDTVLVTVAQTLTDPVITPSGPVNFCPGGSVQLNSSASTGNQWYKDGMPINGATFSNWITSLPGSYTVRYKAGQGCTSEFSAPVIVTVAAGVPTPIIAANGPVNFCQGSNVTLSSSATSGNQWYKDGIIISNATLQNIVVNQAGSYTVRSSNGTCTSDFSSPVIVTVNSIPPIPVVTAAGPVTFCQGSSVSLGSSVSNGNQWYRDGIVISGATNQNYSANQAGSYTAVATNGICSSGSSSAIVVTVNAVPATPVITAGGATSFCQGGSVTLNSSASNGNQWLRDGAAVSGATNQNYVASQSGSYTVITSNGTCSSSASSPIIVAAIAIPSIPTITTGSATSFCEGGSAQLTSSASAGNQWFKNGVLIPGANNQNYSATTSGVFTVRVSVNTCVSDFSQGVTVTVNPNPAAPAIMALSGTTFCQGGSVILSSSATSGNQWYLNNAAISGATGQNYSASTAGNYTTRITSNGCQSNHSTAVPVIVNPIPQTPTITLTGNTLISSSNSGNQWYLNNTPVPGAINASYTPLSSGTYTVQVTSNGCSSAFSTGFNFVSTAINSPVLDIKIRMAPNPVENELFIEYSGMSAGFQVMVMDMNGRQVSPKQNFNTRLLLNMRSVAAGTYIIQVINRRTGERIQRMIIKL